MTEPIHPPTLDASDHALDDRVRAAAEALVALAPAGAVDGLEAWVTSQLALEHRTESRMMSESDNPSGDTPKVPAIDSTKAKPGRTDDSGLHDIKALAKDTRSRISRRTTGQHAIDESLLSASHSGLRAVALPEPALVVSLPEVPATLPDGRIVDARGAAIATATDGASITPITARKRSRAWIAVGGAGLAIAAGLFVVLGMGGDKDQPDGAAASGASTQIATGSAADPSGEAGRYQKTETVAAPAAVEERGAATGGMGSGAIESAPGSSAALAAPPTTADGKADDKAAAAKLRADAEAAKRAAADRSETATPGTAGKGSAAADPTAVKPPAKTDPKKPPGTTGVKPAPTGTPGEKSIEDLLNDASGGAAKPKDGVGGGATGDSAKPAKTGLDSKDIKGGMSAVAGKAQSCFDQHGVAGHVKVRVTIASSGSVSKADATGEFAGTPTGSCVAGVVKGASFPEWTGTSMTVNYGFTLQE